MGISYVFRDFSYNNDAAMIEIRSVSTPKFSQNPDLQHSNLAKIRTKPDALYLHFHSH
jgi:hypothetical protein